MGNKEVTELLITMLGRSAYDNSMKVPQDVSKLVKSVDYLTVQLQMIRKSCDDDNKRYIDEIINNLIGILKK